MKSFLENWLGRGTRGGSSAELGASPDIYTTEEHLLQISGQYGLTFEQIDGFHEFQGKDGESIEFSIHRANVPAFHANTHLAAKIDSMLLREGFLIQLQLETYDPEQVQVFLGKDLVPIAYGKDGTGAIRFVTYQKVNPEKYNGGIESIVRVNTQQHAETIVTKVLPVLQEMAGWIGMEIEVDMENMILGGHLVSVMRGDIQFKVDLVNIISRIPGQVNHHLPTIKNITVPKGMRRSDARWGSLLVQEFEDAVRELGYRYVAAANPSSDAVEFWDKQGYIDRNDLFDDSHVLIKDLGE